MLMTCVRTCNAGFAEEKLMIRISVVVLMLAGSLGLLFSPLSIAEDKPVNDRVTFQVSVGRDVGNDRVNAALTINAEHRNPASLADDINRSVRRRSSVSAAPDRRPAQRSPGHPGDRAREDRGRWPSPTGSALARALSEAPTPRPAVHAHCGAPEAKPAHALTHRRAARRCSAKQLQPRPRRPLTDASATM